MICLFMDIVFDVILDFCINRWDLLLIPFSAAIIGWLTNLLALKMTFYPLDFYGFSISNVRSHGFRRMPAIGWQGIIPAKAAIMAGRAVDLITTKLIDIEDQFDRIDPKVITKQITPKLKVITIQIIDEAMEKELPLLWKLLPQERKNQIYNKAIAAFPHVVEDMMSDVKANIKELFDVKKMVVDALTKDKTLLNSIFLEVGHKEFKFIEYSGFLFGFMFGVIQMIIWSFNSNPLEMWWQLPVGGLLIGYLTNILALRMIFQPLEPINLGVYVLQGLFIKRQKEVSKAYAIIVASKIFTMPNIFNEIITGKANEQLINIVEGHVNKAVDKTAGYASALIRVTSGSEAYDGIKDYTCQRFWEELPKHIDIIFDYTTQALDIESTLQERMAALSPKDFEGFLRPVFQEDEFKLILVGSILGGLAGVLQLIFLL